MIEYEGIRCGGTGSSAVGFLNRQVFIDGSTVSAVLVAQSSHRSSDHAGYQ